MITTFNRAVFAGDLMFAFAFSAGATSLPPPVALSAPPAAALLAAAPVAADR